MKTLSVLIKPASSLCNLKCRYCFYADEAKNREIPNHGVMTRETVDILFERIKELLDNNSVCNICFQGGEPTIAGLEYFKYFINKSKELSNIKFNYSIQTNATLLNDEWSYFLKENNFLIGVSLDGYETNTDYFRIDQNNNGMFFKIMNGIDILKKYDNDFNILTVVTRKLAEHPKALFEFYKTHKFEYIQLIPCLNELDGDNGISLTAKEFASFYKQFFDCWYKDALKGKPLNINLFENIAGMLMGQYPYQCGLIGKCQVQFVIESNGNVYPCDFYCLDDYRIGNICSDSFISIAKKGLNSFVKYSECKKKPCENCRFVNICNGGCRRQNSCYLSDEYCAYQEVLEHIVPIISKLLIKCK